MNYNYNKKFENKELEVAIEWCKSYELEFDAVNENLSTCEINARKIGIVTKFTEF